MTQQSQFEGLTLDEIFDDLCSRFVVNMPADELASIERICFQVEQCHWFYEDFVRPDRPDLPSLSLRRFSELFLVACSPHLSAFSFDPKAAYDAFLRYKSGIPVRGAVLLNPAGDKVVLVKGWKSSAGWGFPRGKINKNESDKDCAVREVWEEIGYDIAPHFDPGRRPHDPRSNGPPASLGDTDVSEDNWLNISVQDQNIRLLVVPNVQEDAVFETQTRKEISKIAWFNIRELPGWSKRPNSSPVAAVTCFDAQGRSETVSASKFFMVPSVIRPLKSWLTKKKPKPKNKELREQQQPPSQPRQNGHTPSGFESLSEANDALHAFFLGSSTDNSTPPRSASDPKPIHTPSETSRDTMRQKVLFDLDMLTSSTSSSPKTNGAAPAMSVPLPTQPQTAPNTVDLLFRSAAKPANELHTPVYSNGQPHLPMPPRLVPIPLGQPPHLASMAMQPFAQPLLPITQPPHQMQPTFFTLPPGPPQFQPHQPFHLHAANISQPTPIRPIPASLLYAQSPPVPYGKVPQQQSATLLGLLNGM